MYNASDGGSLEWLIIAPIVFYIYYRIFKFIRSLFK